VSSPGTETTLTCYRHPRVETAVRCASCERPICTDCMVFSPVGIKCPECAGQATGPRRTAAQVRTAASSGTGALVTKALIAANVLVFFVELAQSTRFNVDSSEVFQRGALYGPLVADGEWWRLVTSGFLHVNFIHIGLNMLVLWWFGRLLEDYVGRARFLGVYVVSLLAGSAGALLLSPTSVTVGASGAVFGVLGAGLVLERTGTYVFGGQALGLIIVNVIFSFVISNVSLGGHLGGLVGGILAMLALSRFGRGHAAYGRIGAEGILGLVAIAAASVAIAYLRVRGYA
jgi:membrane associated rhomboid family serine protease